MNLDLLSPLFLYGFVHALTPILLNSFGQQQLFGFISVKIPSMTQIQIISSYYDCYNLGCADFFNNTDFSHHITFLKCITNEMYQNEMLAI